MTNQKNRRHILRNTWLRIESNNTGFLFVNAFSCQTELAIDKLIL